MHKLAYSNFFYIISLNFCFQIMYKIILVYKKNHTYASILYFFYQQKIINKYESLKE